MLKDLGYKIINILYYALKFIKEKCYFTLFYVQGALVMKL